MRSPSQLRGLTLAAAALLLAPLLPGCGGGGGTPTQPPPPPPPPTSSLTFTPASGAGNDSIVLARTGPTGGTILDLAVEARNLSTIYGAAFDLGYPASVLAYEAATVGEFLSSGGFQVSLQVAEESGNLIVGVTRLGAVPAATGSGTLVTLRFRAVGSGTGQIGFSRTEVVDAQGQTLAVDFFGGTVQSTL